MTPANESPATPEPEAGFAGREASRNGLGSPEQKEEARGGTRGSPALSQVRLLVDDFAGCARFLEDVLGLERTFGDDDDGYASFSAGSGTVAVFRRSEQDEVVGLRAPGDSALVVFEVEDVDAEVARLQDVVVGGPVSKAEWGGRVAYVRDPDGNLFELFQSIPMAE